MKYAIVLGLVMAVHLTSWSQNQVGHVNYGNLLEALPEVEQANVKLKAYQDSIGQALEERMKSHRASIDMNKKKFQAGEMTKVEAEATNRALNEEQAKLSADQQKAEASVLIRRKQMLQPIIKKVNQAIADYGKANGYLFIFDESSGIMLYDRPSDDITEKILESVKNK